MKDGRKGSPFLPLHLLLRQKGAYTAYTKNQTKSELKADYAKDPMTEKEGMDLFPGGITGGGDKEA